jgi:hypothetical protein
VSGEAIGRALVRAGASGAVIEGTSRGLHRTPASHFDYLQRQRTTRACERCIESRRFRSRGATRQLETSYKWTNCSAENRVTLCASNFDRLDREARAQGEIMGRTDAARPFHPDEADEVDMDDRISKLEAHVAHIQSDLTDVKAEVRSIRSEVGAVRADVGALRSDTEKASGSLRAEIGALRSDMEKANGLLRADMGELRSDMEKANGLLRVDMEKANGALRADMERANGALRTDMEKANGTLRADLEKAIGSLRVMMLSGHLALGAGLLAVMARAFKWI